MKITPENRVAILARIVTKAPNKSLGRTQIMKLFYFLQTLKDIPLGYDFRLFNYGPFQSEVLSDLSSACSQNIVIEETLIYSQGYRYAISPEKKAEELSYKLEKDNTPLTTQVDDIVQEFSKFSDSELELLSTIVFVDREFHASGETTPVQEITDRVQKITDRVQKIKPHFDSSFIRQKVEMMLEKNHLQSTNI